MLPSALVVLVIDGRGLSIYDRVVFPTVAATIRDAYICVWCIWEAALACLAGSPLHGCLPRTRKAKKRKEKVLHQVFFFLWVLYFSRDHHTFAPVCCSRRLEGFVCVCVHPPPCVLRLPRALPPPSCARASPRLPVPFHLVGVRRGIIIAAPKHVGLCAAFVLFVVLSVDRLVACGCFFVVVGRFWPLRSVCPTYVRVFLGLMAAVCTCPSIVNCVGLSQLNVLLEAVVARGEDVLQQESRVAGNRLRGLLWIVLGGGKEFGLGMLIILHFASRSRRFYD